MVQDIIVSQVSAALYSSLPAGNKKADAVLKTDRVVGTMARFKVPQDDARVHRDRQDSRNERLWQGEVLIDETERQEKRRRALSMVPGSVDGLAGFDAVREFPQAVPALRERDDAAECLLPNGAVRAPGYSPVY